MENKASNNEDYMESYVMDLGLKLLDKGVQILTVSDPKAYGEYKPYTFLSSQEEFIQKAMKM